MLLLALATSLHALTPAAHAGTVFQSAGAETLLDLNGNWPRAYPDHNTGGWYMFHAGGGDFKLTHADRSLVFDHSNDINLTGRTDLKDHDIRPCPDGTWLQVSTADYVENAHDSMYTWRYDADFNITYNSTIAENDTTTGGDYVDTPAICGDVFQGGAFFVSDDNPDTTEGDVPSRFVSIDSEANAVGYHDLMAAPTAIGSSMFEDKDQTMWFVGFTDQSYTDIVVAHYDNLFNQLSSELINVTPEGNEAYFGQTSIRVGQYYIVAHMIRDTSQEWTQQNGDIYLSAFDSDWNLVDQIQLSHNVAPDGGNQPFVVNAEDGTLLAMYAKDLKNYAFEVTLDPSVEWDSDTDTDADTDTDTDTDSDTDTDTDTDADTDSGGGNGGNGGDDSGTTTDPGPCGCAAGAGASGAAGIALAGLALVAASRRRR